MEKKPNAITAALSKLLKPLARLLLRNGIAYADFAIVARRAYVEVANEDFAVEGRKQSASRISVLTGIHRHDVARILKTPLQATPMALHHNRAAQIISAWQNDNTFSTDGAPNCLTLNEEFAALVAKHGGDVTPRAVLDELQRVGAIESDGSNVQLLVKAFTPLGSMDDLLHLLGDSAADLLETLDHNLSCEEQERRMQLSVVYNNLPDEVLPNLELVASDRAMVFMQELNEFFATQDRDSNPGSKGNGRNRAGVGLYFFKHAVDEE